MTGTNSNRGLAAGLAAYIWWGLFPLYLKPLHALDTMEVIAHRVAWSCVFILIWMLARSELGRVREALTNPALLWRLGVSAGLITLNWVVYVFAVANGHVLEAEWVERRQLHAALVEIATRREGA